MLPFVAKAMEGAWPVADSNIPPTQTGILLSLHNFCIFNALVKPPTLLVLIFIHLQALISIAFFARAGELMLSSRQMGVDNSF